MFIQIIIKKSHESKFECTSGFDMCELVSGIIDQDI
jgi:hypothetical protein